jgi:ElaB/YqjD/DUF883 family membrane-anchored ribosome-binding protein
MANGHGEDTGRRLTGRPGLQAAGKLDDVKGTTEDFIDRIERTAGDLGERLSDAATKARDRVREMVGDVDVASARESVQRHTQANPLRSLLVAGVIGVVIGRYLLPKRN